jgi:putative copper resistance protein D
LSEAVSVIFLSQAFSKFRIPSCSILLLFMIFSGLAPAPTFAQNPPAHHNHAGMSMPMDDDQDPAKLLADKKESEFNHHLAGVFVVLAGLFILTSDRLKARWPAIKYAWPLCFLLSGMFVFIFSDTELWPFGPKDWWTGVTGNLEVLQHKTFAVILLGLGIIEILRARGTLRAVWSAWIFPVLAVAGSVMLLFHTHDAGMHGEDAMTAMHRIQMQHFSYAAIGASIGLSRGLSDTSLPARRVFERIWPLLMIALGVVLMFYTE